jgi:hypothetical protein
MESCRFIFIVFSFFIFLRLKTFEQLDILSGYGGKNLRTKDEKQSNRRNQQKHSLMYPSKIRCKSGFKKSD